MPCYSPLTAYYSREIGKSGKRGITFSRDASFTGVALKLPCGQCVGCRLEKSRQWAMRCMHEKQLHDRSCFVTLTYNDDKLPAGGTLVKRDVQLFMKRVRKAHGEGIRFYACGEYGETTGRPHYHILLFNLDFDDKRFFKKARGGDNLYVSRSLDSLWPNGFAVVGSVSFDSAAYCARYIMKKITGNNAKEYYEVVDKDGLVYAREPEFTVMSRRPGIGLRWFERFGGQVYTWDSCIVNGKEVRPPRYYDTKYELVDNFHLESLKLKRRREAAKHVADNRSDRLRVREQVTVSRLAMKGRML